jgi:hypothetical protein
MSRAPTVPPSIRRVAVLALLCGTASLLACSKGSGSKPTDATSEPPPPETATPASTAHPGKHPPHHAPAGTGVTPGMSPGGALVPPGGQAPPGAPPVPEAEAPFHGSYAKYAERTYKNGRPVRSLNTAGTASIKIEGGKVTWAQTYKARGKVNHVTQIYTFTPDAMKPATDGYDVALVWQSIEGDTQSYSPDKNRPVLEARKQAAGHWEIGLVTTDNNGVLGGSEFK